MIKRLMSVSTLVLLGGFTMAQAASSPIDNDVYRVEQTATCQGKVVDENGSPLIGASVAVKGNKTQGSVTDVNGAFSIKGVAKGATLHVSYIGYKATDVKWNGQSVTVTLVEDDNALDEAVVVGYGTMKKSDLSGASVSMKESDIKGSLITNLDQALQGRAAGVTAVQTSGAPGSSSSIRVRGTATINANAEPLYVIDGVIVQSQGQNGYSYGLGDALGNGDVSTISPLASIDPSDIVSMEILKDASATAIYGAQGANGVVLITTKHGREGEAKFNYNGGVSLSRQMRRLDILNLHEYADYYNMFVNVGEADPNPLFVDNSLLGKGTNWQDAIFQTAFQHNHQVSAEGGTERVKYYVSGAYMNQEGTIIGSEFNRLSLRTNLDANLFKWLKMGTNLAYSNSNDNIKHADGEEGIINYSLTTTPTLPIYDIDGNYASATYEGSNSPNPIAMAMMNEILLNRQKFNGNIFLEFKFYKDLTLHSELGFDISSSKGDRYKPVIELATYHQNINSASVQKNSNKFWQLKNYLTWNHTFNQHNVTGMVGQECWESLWDYMSISRTALPSDAVHNPALGTGDPSVGVGFGSAAMASFFTRWTYGFSDRYNATYTYRYDGSSNFGPENRWAGFHSFAASWRFDREAFLKDVEWLSNGKLRVGWGQTGNSAISGYLWGVGLKNQTSALGISNRPSNIANTGIKWETQEQINVGLDLGFFNSRLNFVVDWYNKESRDMLMPLQLPSYMGTQGNGSSALAAPKGNYGTIRNRGIEVTVDAHPFQGRFSWDSSLQISVNRNKLVALNDGTGNATLPGWGQWGDQEPLVARTEVGSSLFNFFGYVCDGYYTSKEDIENSPTPLKPGVLNEATGELVYSKNSTVWVGDIKYKDINKDGKIDDKDRTNIGSPLPKFTFGWNNTFRWNNWELNIFINGSYGNKVGNFTAYKLTEMKNTWVNQLSSVLNSVRFEAIDPNMDYSEGVDRGDGVLIWNWYDDINNVKISNLGDATMPRVSQGNPNWNTRWSDRYIEDGSYIRLKNISLAYNFPKHWIKKAHIDNLRLSANIQNLYTLTKYKGYDPEVGASTQSSYVFGLDNGRYPSPTTYQIGLNIGF